MEFNQITLKLLFSITVKINLEFVICVPFFVLPFLRLWVAVILSGLFPKNYCSPRSLYVENHRLFLIDSG